MALFTLHSTRIAGIAAAVPKTIAFNRDVAILTEKERSLLIRTTGIEERRIAGPETCASDLCQAAAEKLLDELEWEKDSVQALIFVTQTPDYLMPATAMLIQERMGLPKSCLALDIHQGCAGYVYGLSILAGLLSASGLSRALLLVGDTITRTLSSEDKSTAPIFSDAGSATALAFDREAPAMHFNLQSDGAGYRAILIEEGGARKPATPASFEAITLERGIRRAPNQMAMQGLDVFTFALREVVPNLMALLDHAGHSLSSADYLVFHQANLLLNEAIRKKLGVEAVKIPYSLRKFGNTSCATIPLTIVSCLSKAVREAKQKLLLSGFGVGLSWGSAWVETNGIACPEILEI